MGGGATPCSDVWRACLRLEGAARLDPSLYRLGGGYRVLRGSPQFEIDDCYSVDHLSVLAIFLGSTDSTILSVASFCLLMATYARSWM